MDKTTSQGKGSKEGVNEVLSEEVYQYAKEFPQGRPVTETLSAILSRFLGPYRVEARAIRDVSDRVAPAFDAVVYLQPPEPDGIVLFDSVAAAIDIHATLTKEALRDSVGRIAFLKSLKRTPGSPEMPAPLGIIFAKSSPLTLEQIAEELDQICEKTPGEHWADAVAIMNRGFVNYAVQFPREQPAGDYFFAAVECAYDAIPPFYLVRMIQPTGDRTLNKLVSFIAARSAISAPPGALPDFQAFLTKVPTHGLVHTGYQYIVGGQVTRVPANYYNDRHVPLPPYLISGADGKPLGTVQFVPWQNGGVILAQRFPIDPFFLFLKVAVPGLQLGRAMRLQRGDTQLSYVLPITRSDFTRMLTVMQQQTAGLSIVSAAQHLINQKIADEGTNSPFVARIMLGLFKLRDLAFNTGGNREHFDKCFEAILSGLSNARASQKEIEKLWNEHAAKIQSGQAVKFSAYGFEITESIDQELREKIEGFINASVRVLKNGMQKLAKDLDTDIGCLFQKQHPFEAGIKVIGQNDALLAAYLTEARAWTAGVMEVRNEDLEHGIWVLPKIQYVTQNAVSAQEPLVRDRPITEFVTHTLDRLLCFVEEVTAHCLQKKMPLGVSFVDVPVAQRGADAPERFCATLIEDGKPVWALAYHQSKFEEV